MNLLFDFIQREVGEGEGERIEGTEVHLGDNRRLRVGGYELTKSIFFLKILHEGIRESLILPH